MPSVISAIILSERQGYVIHHVFWSGLEIDLHDFKKKQQKKSLSFSECSPFFW